MSAEAAPPVIRGTDAQGRPVEIPRDRWAREFLPGALAQAPDQNALANVILFAAQNGCAVEVMDHARNLARNDADRVRGRNLYAVVLLAAGRDDEAEKELENLLVFAGDEPTALVNLASLAVKRKDAPRASDLLRRAVQADPNHDTAFTWCAENARRQGGDAGFLAMCREFARDARAWRARLHLARARLALGEVDAALALYREALPGCSPYGDALTQITGDLANAGRLAEAADLVAGVYRPDRHGPYPGVNLVRILGRLGRLDEAQKLLSDGRRLFGPPWKATFDQIEAELSRAPGAPA